jgi:AraC family transcriptional regulator
MRQGHDSSAMSSVWLTPDLGLGFHHFDYSRKQYDGLAHMHGEYCVVMCLSGSMEVLREQQRDLLHAGEILIVNPGEIHRCRFAVDAAHASGFTLILRPAVLRPLLEAMSMPYCAFSRDFRFVGRFRNAEVFELVAKLIREYQDQQRGYATMAETLVRQILVHLLRSWPADAVLPLEFHLPPQLPWLHMHRATEYMNSHGKGAFRLTDLCAAVGLSPSRFIPLFKNSSGVSPHNYYNALLVLKARRLIQLEGSTTKEAAYALGFKNVSHFCTLFHQLAGATPTMDHCLSPVKAEALHAFTNFPQR